MQEAISHRKWVPGNPLHKSPVVNNTTRTSVCKSLITGRQSPATCNLKRTVEENAVVVFAIKGCCMGHVAKRLLQTLGANPTVYEVEEEEEEEKRVAVQLHRRELKDEGRDLPLPAVFIGGRWFGGLDRIIATHISGELTPLLKQAGALWL